ncbi:MAG: protein phosphatase 2C domain-containing protein [Pseudomonadota bacterium]
MNTPASDRLQFGPLLELAAHSSAGVHPRLGLENQDNYLLIDVHGRAVFLRDQQECLQRVAHWPAGHARVAVLDGMGGHGQGRQAAEAVVAGLLAIPACATLGALSAQLDALHTSLQHHFGLHDNPARRPGTTLTMLELRPGQPALLYHVGDSRLYQLGDGQITPLTIDHVPATAYAMAGQLDEHEWWQQVHGEHRPQISQAFILGNAIANTTLLSDPLFELTPLNLPTYLYHLQDRRALELRPGCSYLLASDGFWACAEPFGWVSRWPGLLEGRHSARAACNALFDEIANRPPDLLHADNLTAILIRVKEMS